MSLDRIQIDPQSPVDAERVNRIQTNVARAISAVDQADKIVKVTFSVANTDTRLYHNFGRPFVGARQIRSTAAVSIYDGSPSLDPKKYANLKASAPATVTFEVF